MENALPKPISEAAVLTRSLEMILRAIIRMLVGRLSFVKFEELARKIYVQESEKRLKVENPKKRVTLSRLALLTGLDTRALTRLTNSQSYAQPAYEDDSFLKEITPENHLLNVWTSDPHFCDTSSGTAKALSLGDESPSFSELVSCLSSSRGLTQQSILSRLETGGSVRVDWESQKVELVSTNYYPFLSNDDTAMLELGFSASASMLHTVEQNMSSAGTGEEKLFQRIIFTQSLPPIRKSECRQLLGGMLNDTYDECEQTLLGLEDEQRKPGQITAGVGMFYFESEQGV